ncbi:hypothetical protein ACTXT7_006255 [Hymenolepis weldensis]
MSQSLVVINAFKMKENSMHFQNYFLFAFSMTILRFFIHEAGVFYVPMTHNPYLPWLNVPINFPLFHYRLVSPKKHICAHVLTRPYLSDSYKAIFVYTSITTHACQLPAPTLPAHLSSSARSSLYLPLCHSFQTRCGFLEYTLVYSTLGVLLHYCCQLLLKQLRIVISTPTKKTEKLENSS